MVDTANAISCGDVHVVLYSNEKFEYKQLDKDKPKSGPDPKVFQYVQSESKPTCTTDVSVFAIDDVGQRPRILWSKDATTEVSREASVLLPECPVGRVGCFSGALRSEEACFVVSWESCALSFPRIIQLALS